MGNEPVGNAAETLSLIVPPLVNLLSLLFSLLVGVTSSNSAQIL